MSAALVPTNVVAFPGQPAAAPAPAVAGDGRGAVDLRKRRRELTEFVTVKADETDEQREAWAYYYVDQIPPHVKAAWRARGQPEITFPMVDTVADGATGIIAEMRGDPKAYPRTANNDEAAEVATQCIRSVLDSSNWQTEDTEAIRQAYVAGIAVVQLDFVEGDNQDDDIRVSRIDPTTFFYDPRSLEADFSDARFMGVSKWATADEVDEMFPGMGEAVQDALDGGMGVELTAFDTDRDQLWAQGRKRVRLVEHWWKEAGEWQFCFYAGSVELMAGPSPYRDERGRTICRFFAFANRIDHKGVHHGFHRRLKGAQDAINQHRSKAMHIMNTRQVKKRKGAGAQTIEETKREAARPDGVLLWDANPNEVEILSQDSEFLKQTQYYQDAKGFIEHFGPTQAAMGDGGAGASGRALAMLMRAGMAQLGPFITNLRDWRLRIYKAIWAQVKNTWTNERIIRVTGDEDAPKFLAINRLALGPDGMPALSNIVSAMNVDIIADEGPHTVNVMADVFDTLIALANNKVPVAPAVIIEMSGLPGSVKRKMLGMLMQPDPDKQAATQTQLQNKQADTAHKLASAAHQEALAKREHVGSAVDVAGYVSPPAAPQPPAPSPGLAPAF